MAHSKMMRKIVTLAVLHRYYIQKNASTVGLYAGQPMILDFLKRNGGSAQKDIAADLHVSPASITVSLKRMEKNGFVSKAADGEDMRRNIIQLTEKGRSALDAFFSVCNALDQKMFGNFSADELKQLNGFMDRLIENLLDGDAETEIVRAFEMDRAQKERRKKAEQ